MNTREKLEIDAGLLGMDLDYEPEVAVEDIEKMTEVEWLQSRQSGIGGSDAGALMGYNHYTTASAILLGKKKPITAAEKKDANTQYTLDFGHALEAPMIKLYESITGYHTFTDRRQFRHPKYKWMLGDCDGFAVTDSGEVIGLECKTFNYEMKNLWTSGVFGEGAKVKNDEYVIQMAHYCSVLNIDRIDLIAICGNKADDIVIITYNRDLELEKELIEVEAKAWEDLEKGTIPEFYTLNKYQYKNMLNAITTDEVKVSEPANLPANLLENIKEILNLEEEKTALKKQIEKIEERVNALRIPIIEALGNHEIGVFANEDESYKITYKGSVTKGVDVKRMEVCDRELFEKYRKDTVKSPTFRITQTRR